MKLTIATPERRHRLIAALSAAAIQVALLWALVAGLTVPLPAIVERGLKLFAVLPPPPPPPPPQRRPPPHTGTRPRRSPAPPDLRARATPVAAPTPVVALPAPPVIVTAATPAAGAQARSGAADVAGPGSGAGGAGNGDGGGGDGGEGIGPRQRGGRLKDADYPPGAAAAGTGGTVAVRYRVGVDGRVAECEIAQSSGSAALDETTCRLIRQRFRFDPARDGRGRKVPAWIIERHTWVIERAPDPPPPPQ